jgi:hypothetical protein
MRQTVIEQALLEADDPSFIANPVFERFPDDPRSFYDIVGFSAAEFGKLYELVEPHLNVIRRGRHQIIGPIDSFLLFLHWLRTANPPDRIAAGFSLSTEEINDSVLKMVIIIASSCRR